MQKIKSYELVLKPQASSSYFPLPPPYMKRGEGAEFGGNWEPIGSTKDISKKRFTYLPCHYFDYIAGSGTGG